MLNVFRGLSSPVETQFLYDKNIVQDLAAMHGLDGVSEMRKIAVSDAERSVGRALTDDEKSRIILTER